MNTYLLRVYSYTFTEIVLKIVKSSLTSVVPKTQFTHHVVYSLNILMKQLRIQRTSSENGISCHLHSRIWSLCRKTRLLSNFDSSIVHEVASLPLTILSCRSIAINQLWIAENCTIFPNTVVEWFFVSNNKEFH